MSIYQKAFTPDVIEAWREVVRRSQNAIKIKKGSGPHDTEGIVAKLHPVRELLRQAADRYLATIPAYNGLYFRLGHLWNYGNLKQYFWISASEAHDKTLGRLQLVFGPQEEVYSEYVAYKKTELGRQYHIERLAEWFQMPAYFSKARQAVDGLPAGFWFSCGVGGGKSIGKYVGDLGYADWQHIEQNSLSTDEYFSISHSYSLETVKDLTVDELARLLVADLAEMSDVYNVMQNGPDCTPHVQKQFVLDSSLRRLRNEQEETERLEALEADPLAEQAMFKRAMAAKNRKGRTGPGNYYGRDADVAATAKRLAKGVCALCGQSAPFNRKDNGLPFLEAHHVAPLFEGGSDAIENVVALCPNCHRKLHHWQLEKDIVKLQGVGKNNLENVKQAVKG